MDADTVLEPRSLFFEDLAIGMSESLQRTVTDAAVRAFAEVSGDRNPIHLDDDYAAGTLFKSRIAHGVFTASLISAVLGMRLPGPGVIYFSQTLNFRGPVRIGDVVHVRLEIAELMPEKCRARIACTCTVAGEVVLDGDAWVKVPSRLPKPDTPKPGTPKA
jgi:3-hydroxybutyryl-CoA dehydratase